MSRLAVLLVLGFALAAVAVLAAFGYLALRKTHIHPNAYVECQIEGVRLNYPVGYARFPLGRAGGRLDRLELAATIPEMQPAGDIYTALPIGGASSERDILFLSIGPEQKSAPPDLRAAMLYATFLDPEVVDDSGGLVMRRFQAGSPYEGEDLFLDPPDGRQFAARCLRPTPLAMRLPLTCVTAIRQNGLDVELRFGREALPHWSAIMAGARGLIASMATR